MTASLRALPLDRFRVAAGLLVLAAVGHALAIPHHADPGHGGPVQVAAFAAIAAAQLLGAAAIVRGSATNRQRALVVIGSVVLTALWAVSRTAGLPYGPHPGEAETIGVLDALTVAAQLVVIGLLVRTSRALRLPMAFATSFAVVVIGMAALNVAREATPAGVTSHHAEPSVDSHGKSQEPVDARAAGPTAATSPDDRDPADADRGHSHDDLNHPHP